MLIIITIIKMFTIILVIYDSLLRLPPVARWPNSQEAGPEPNGVDSERHRICTRRTASLTW